MTNLLYDFAIAVNCLNTNRQLNLLHICFSCQPPFRTNTFVTHFICYECDHVRNKCVTYMICYKYDPTKPQARFLRTKVLVETLCTQIRQTAAQDPEGLY